MKKRKYDPDTKGKRHTMDIVSPFDGLQVPKEIVCEFFATFARFEYALKECGFVKAQYGRATPHWKKLADQFGSSLSKIEDNAVAKACRFLLCNPPQVQVLEDNNVIWKPIQLSGKSDGACVLDAVRRVRNNLFHGGKNFPHSPPGRDEELVRSALIVLHACLSLDENIRTTYEKVVL